MIYGLILHGEIIGQLLGAVILVLGLVVSGSIAYRIRANDRKKK